MYNLLTAFMCLAALCAHAFAAEEGESALGFELLPKGRPFRLTFADPREIRLALSIEGDSRLNANVGNYFSLFAVEAKDSWRMHFGLEGAGFFTMRQADHRFPLETADGLIGTYLEGESGDLQFQLRYTHISAHLADGMQFTPIAYSREFVVGRVAYAPSPSLHVYGGARYLTHSVPELPGWTLQMGGEFFLPWHPGKLTPFAAFDLRMNRESQAFATFSGQLGIALNNPPEAYRSFRLFYSYYTGADPRGQFFSLLYTAHALGIEMQI